MSRPGSTAPGRSRFHRVAVSTAAGALVLGACGADEPPAAASTSPPTAELPATTMTEVAVLPDVMEAWVRMPAVGQAHAAAYVTFVNPGAVDVALLGVASTTGDAELHETVADADGVMRMQHRPGGFVVPGGGELVMSPGGIHVMLWDVDVLELALADAVELTFDFGPLGSVVATAQVRGDTVAPSTSRDEHDDMSHHDDRGVDLDVTLDPRRLHDLDDELHAGVFEPERQRGVVAGFRAGLEALEDVPAGFDVAALLDVLDRLDDALARGAVDEARALAFEAHDLAHDLVPHGHDH